MNAHASLTSQLAQRISATIRRRKLVEGAFFMTEEQIAQRFKTSRRVAREAVAHLTSLGVLRSRRGQGITIGKPDPTGLLLQTVPFYAQDQQDYWNLAELRYGLEVGIADLAVAHASDEQIQRLEQLAREFGKLVGETFDWDRLCELECAFHGQILQATGNRLIMGMHAVILNFFRIQRELLPNVAAPSTQALAEDAALQHAQIAAALRVRDAARFRDLLRDHLSVASLRATGVQPPAPAPARRQRSPRQPRA